MKRKNHNNRQVELPNFCHLGVNLRIALTVEAALVAGAVARASNTAGFWADFIALSALAQPALLLTLLALCAAGRWLRSQPYRQGAGAALAIGVLVPVGVFLWLAPLLMGLVAFSPAAVAVFSLVSGAGLLAYFNLRARALSPAITEARLQALQARIRPHFLFNSLNAVLSLVRSDPRRAEHALENMADLFRALMSDARQLAPLEEEVALTR
ncbi:MAG: histidine kinase, partial [Gammaproteobacteria bacterium]|nr:histidine kinase [Gammaproteobacteria bacterium]